MATCPGLRGDLLRRLRLGALQEVFLTDHRPQHRSHRQGRWPLSHARLLPQGQQGGAQKLQAAHRKEEWEGRLEWQEEREEGGEL